MKPFELAAAFAEKLSRILTADQLAKVNQMNLVEEVNGNRGVCHSHDFCDSNQVMLDAMGEEFENSDEQNRLINDAWKIAKASDFHVATIKRNWR